MSDLGTIIKDEIKSLVKSHDLITKEYKKERIKEACYLSHTSNEFFEIKNNTKLIKINNDEYFILKPNNSVVCKTAESFKLPTNMIARVLLTGHYFSIGIAPINTYADPGFDGHLGIVLTNTSKNYIKILPNEPLVKIEFSYINGHSDPYVGQHGADLKTWPLRSDLILTSEELLKNSIDINSISEAKEVHGVAIASMIESLQESRKSLYRFTALAAILPMGLLWGIQENFDLNSPYVGVGIGILTGLIVNYLYKFLNKW